MLILAALATGAWLGARQIYFLGVDEGGRMALYRGLPYELPFEVSLYSEVYSAAVQADSVPEERQDSITDHELRSRDDAVSLLEDLEDAATQTEPPAPTPSPQNNGGGGDGRDRNGRGQGGDGNGPQGGNRNGRSAGGGGVGGSREAELSGRKSQGTPGTADRTRGYDGSPS